MNDTKQIIIVEDDQLMARAMKRHLILAGYAVSIATSGVELKRICGKKCPDLVLLDLNLGGGDGMCLARELLGTSPTSIIIVTGRHEVQDCIEALDAGADDCITKPFDMDELLARVRSILRRRDWLSYQAKPVELGALRLDPINALLTDTERGLEVRFTETEARILELLMRYYNRALSRANLLNRESVAPDERSVDVHVANIRRKLRAAGIDSIVIWPLRGYGYRLRLEPPCSV